MILLHACNLYKQVRTGYNTSEAHFILHICRILSVFWLILSAKVGLYFTNRSSAADQIIKTKWVPSLILDDTD